jgi:hypothetical protein
MTKNSFVPPDAEIKVLDWPKLGKPKPAQNHAQRKASRIAEGQAQEQAEAEIARKNEADRHEDDTDN